MFPRPVPAAAPPRPYTVSELLAEVSGVLRATWRDVSVVGEIARYDLRNGHGYFTIKDKTACLSAIMFASDLRHVPFRIQAGLEIVVRGCLDLYAPQGRFQIRALAVEPVGQGARRVAQPRPTRGENAPYDREAKKLCYLIGISFVRQGDAYRRYYHDQRARLEGAKPDWIPRRRHLTALRMTEKLFLAHLWLVWREELGLPVTAPYADQRDDAAPTPRPWAMVTA